MLNLSSPFWNTKRSLSIITGANPFMPTIDFSISTALDTSFARKNTHAKFTNKKVNNTASHCGRGCMYFLYRRLTQPAKPCTAPQIMNVQFAPCQIPPIKNVRKTFLYVFKSPSLFPPSGI